ncbi:MAG: thioredoxin domain-containing protein [Magnetococcales bacterium]|nr:thioredoxin domain-containing protein [Magnetococcales bacterium]MBF0114832.1 thioredoxin domain-containing protein [Magnetococcales bacterium]
MRTIGWMGCLISVLLWPQLGWSEPVAKAGNWTLRLEEVDKALADKLHELRESRIQEMVVEHLLEAEAKAKGVSANELLEKQVDAKVVPPSKEEVAQFIAANRSRLPNEGQGMEDKIREFMLDKKKDMARDAYLKELWDKNKVEILLKPPRVTVSAPDDLARGKADAPITLIEFSDFECPYCRRAQPVLKELEKAYGDKIRFVFRHYPLSFHQQAPKASEAAQCAADQGQFWPFHAALFSEGVSLAPADLKKTAGKLGLNQATFDACLDSGRHAGRVEKDSDEGKKLGITGTPTFFVNGIRLVGAVPLDRFKQVIDDELQGKK